MLFGSRVSGKVHRESDNYDIAYLGKKPLSISEERQLVFKLAPLLKIPLKKPEVIFLENASPLFLKKIFDDAKVIYAKDNLIFEKYRIYAIRLFEEFRYVLQKHRIKNK